jgi:UDP-N-acetylglucosamine pyrophosphorylase
MKDRNIDVDLSLDVLRRFNRGDFDHFERVRVSGIPEVDGETIVDFTKAPSVQVETSAARDRLAGVLPEAVVQTLGKTIGHDQDGLLALNRSDLETVGLALMPRVAYGVLNGGSATSYADRKKNQAFSAKLIDLAQREFDELAKISEGRAKGLTPAFLQPDGEPGPSFLQLKMRGLLALAVRSRRVLERLAPDESDRLPHPALPFFEMTSIHTSEELRLSYPEYGRADLLADLIRHTGMNPTEPLGAVQPMLAAYTHSREGRPKRVFTHAHGTEDRTLALPGGHGQGFAVLADVYRTLRSNGKRFVTIGNVDNLGYLPDPVEVAYLALTGRQAVFDFSFRTPVDVKGGILVRNQRGALSCADIGPAISREEVDRAELSGRPILFNAASGLFDLEYLVPNLERIAAELPTRFTDQSKDAGDYSQAEQVTWEVIDMLDDFLIFSVDKWDRFLAAKLLAETLMTSGVKLDDPDYPSSADPAGDLRTAAQHLHRGLKRKLELDYGMELRDGRWAPVAASRLAGAGS